jgi:hypothetical protein
MLVKGTKIKNEYGKIETVLTADETRVITYESKNSWYHPSKVWEVK